MCGRYDMGELGERARREDKSVTFIYIQHDAQGVGESRLTERRTKAIAIGSLS